jgi:hypothetical protein
VLSLLGSERGNRGDPETWHDFVPVCGDAAIADVIASDDYDRLIIELRNGSAMLTILRGDVALQSIRSGRKARTGRFNAGGCPT